MNFLNKNIVDDSASGVYYMYPAGTFKACFGTIRYIKGEHEYDF